MFNQTFNHKLTLTLWGIVFISLLLFTSFHANAQLPSSVDRTSIGIGTQSVTRCTGILEWQRCNAFWQR